MPFAASTRLRSDASPADVRTAVDGLLDEFIERALEDAEITVAALGADEATLTEMLAALHLRMLAWKRGALRELERGGFLHGRREHSDVSVRMLF